MKKLLLLLLAIAAVAGVAYRIISARDAAQAKSARVPPAVPVALAQVTIRDMPRMLEVVGRAEAYASVALKSRVDGQVAAVNFTEGQHVRQGEVLVRLDPADFKARLLQAEATVARDQAQLAKAKVDVEHYIALKNRGFVSEEKVNDLRTVEASAAATLRVDQAAVDLARLQLSYSVIVAPSDGIVGARLVFPGTGVKNNDTTLAVVNQVRPIYVTFAVPEKHLPRIRAAMKAGVLKGTVSLPGGGERFEGEARFLDNAVDPASGTIQMKATFANAGEKLTPGQFVNVALVLDTVSNAQVIPAQAVQQGSQGNFVYVVKSDNSVEVRKIELLFTRDNLAVIDKGLQGGETVVTDGQLRLTPGVKVQAREAGKAPARSPAPAAS